MLGEQRLHLAAKRFVPLLARAARRREQESTSLEVLGEILPLRLEQAKIPFSRHDNEGKIKQLLRVELHRLEAALRDDRRLLLERRQKRIAKAPRRLIPRINHIRA